MAGPAACPAQSRSPSWAREFHPEPLTDPDVNLSIHPARATAQNKGGPVSNAARLRAIASISVVVTPRNAFQLNERTLSP